MSGRGDHACRLEAVRDLIEVIPEGIDTARRAPASSLPTLRDVKVGALRIEEPPGSHLGACLREAPQAACELRPDDILERACMVPLCA